jgi:hypothetical protein
MVSFARIHSNNRLRAYVRDEVLGSELRLVRGKRGLSFKADFDDRDERVRPL